MRRLLAVVAFAVMIVPLLPADAAQAQRQQRTSGQQSRQTLRSCPGASHRSAMGGPEPVLDGSRIRPLGELRQVTRATCKAARLRMRSAR